MERGRPVITGLMQSSIDPPVLVLVVPGSKTSRNPIKAFAQGLANESPDRVFSVVFDRCESCGFLEFFGEQTKSSMRP
jgi:hypothetical protein